MLLVRGLLMPRSIMVAVTLRVCSSRLSKSRAGTWVLEQAELTEQGKGVAAGVAHGGRPTGERPGAQMRGALKAAKAGNKKLAAPNGPIGAGAGAVKGRCQGRARRL